MEDAIEKRHDIVHRNGKTKEGKEIIITKADISELINNVRVFVGYIDDQLKSSSKQLKLKR